MPLKSSGKNCLLSVFRLVLYILKLVYSFVYGYLFLISWVLMLFCCCFIEIFSIAVVISFVNLLLVLSFVGWYHCCMSTFCFSNYALVSLLFLNYIFIIFYWLIQSIFFFCLSPVLLYLVLSKSSICLSYLLANSIVVLYLLVNYVINILFCEIVCFQACQPHKLLILYIKLLKWFLIYSIVGSVFITWCLFTVILFHYLICWLLCFIDLSVLAVLGYHWHYLIGCLPCLQFRQILKREFIMLPVVGHHFVSSFEQAYFMHNCNVFVSWWNI